MSSATARDVTALILAARIRELQLELDWQEKQTFPNIDRKNLLGYKISKLTDDLLEVSTTGTMNL